MTKKISAELKERSFQRRLAVWRHNAHLGSCKMAEQNMMGIIESRTTRDESKLLAKQITVLLCRLGDSLRTRAKEEL